MKHSIIIPAFNAVQYLQACVMSVLPQLGSDDELFIVDDASTDDTGVLARSFTDHRIHVLTQAHNQGVAAARNRGLERASGDYLHFLDQDDLWTQDRMQCLSPLIALAQPDIVSGWVEHFHCPSLSEEAQLRFPLPPPQAASLPGSVVIRRALVQELGMFDISLPSGEFIDYLSSALVKNVYWHKVGGLLLRRRIHGLNYTLSDSMDSSGYLTTVRRHLSRRQAT